MNRKLLIKVQNYSELKNFFDYLRSINEHICEQLYDEALFNSLYKYQDISIGFLEDDLEWDWDGDSYWGDRPIITYKQFFREHKLKRICND